MGHVVSFEHKGANVTMDVWCGDTTGSIELVSSKYKKRYLATYVMRKAMAYADFLDIDLVLEVMPFGNELTQMLKPDLKAWYMTFGFVYKGDDVMERKRKSERDKSVIDVQECSE